MKVVLIRVLIRKNNFDESSIVKWNISIILEQFSFFFNRWLCSFETMGAIFLTNGPEFNFVMFKRTPVTSWHSPSRTLVVFITVDIRQLTFIFAWPWSTCFWLEGGTLRFCRMLSQSKFGLGGYPQVRFLWSYIIIIR